MAEDIHSLNAGFDPADDAAWRALAEKALKGAGLSRIERKTADGLARGPLFTRSDLDAVMETGAPGAAPFVRGLTAQRDAYLPWAIRQAVGHGDPKRANAAMLEELSGGASEILLQIDPKGRHGTAIRTLDEMKTALDGVMLDLAPVHLAPGPDATQSALLLLALLKESGLDGEALRGGLGLSPYARAARLGLASSDLEDELSLAVEAARWTRDHTPGVRVLRVDAALIHEAGGSEAQELAWLCASGAGYMHTLIDAGLSADAAAQTLEFSVAADADIHLTIAKLRAARRVWSQVAEVFGCSQEHRGLHLHVTTSRRMLTARDAWTNLIRISCAALGAAAGGADAITTRRFTDAKGAPTGFARRLSRNVQIMLGEESHIGKVADPAGGGYLHETLGQRLAQAGWDVFQDIERRGGVVPALEAGWLQGEIATMRETRRAAYASGREMLIGVSTYPELDAKDAEIDTASHTPPALKSAALPEGSVETRIEAAGAGAQIAAGKRPDPAWEALSPIRFAEPFEALRADADAHAEKTGSRPRAFLATLGALADFNARAGFAKNRLAVGGIEPEGGEVYDSLDDCAAAFKASGSPLAVICGTDTAYETQAGELARALKDAGAEAVWVAGKAMEIAGADHFIHMRSDAVEDLTRAHAILGVA
ncbi:methylmalonyl-CoA mutase family protein [Marinicauda pacifica]|uniref:methylmalonyl-CoA mutase family protein n=1 Tax=Marinicauda pacifica TaxID=1133559 RepID=UPI0035C80A8D